MRLYLVQHGQAQAEEKDPQRPLTEEGKVQTEKIAKFLRIKNITVDSIWHSKKMRARQTAQIISQYVAGGQIQERDDLNPKDSVEKFPDQIQTLNKDLLIVGHLPFLQKLTAKLLLGSEDDDLVAFRYSGVVCLEYNQSWKIVWMVIPDLI